MKRALQFLALALALVGIFAWAALGANRGWTKTQAQVRRVDEVTGIEGITYRKQFQPGLDFLSADFLLAGALAICSIFARKPANHNPQETQK